MHHRVISSSEHWIKIVKSAPLQFVLPCSGNAHPGNAPGAHHSQTGPYTNGRQPGQCGNHLTALINNARPSPIQPHFKNSVVLELMSRKSSHCMGRAVDLTHSRDPYLVKQFWAGVGAPAQRCCSGLRSWCWCAAPSDRPLVHVLWPPLTQPWQLLTHAEAVGPQPGCIGSISFKVPGRCEDQLTRP